MIRHLLLDLDNTLYRASDGMDEGISRRMIEFVAHHIGVTVEEGKRLRLERMPKYGTTLEWLRTEHELVDMDSFFRYVHPESEIDELKPDPALRKYLLDIGLPMTLLTNSPMIHADRVLRFYDIRDIFTGIHDIVSLKGNGKPHPAAFLTTLEASGYGLDETLFLDDLPKYVRGYKAIGGKAVIVDESGMYAEMAKEEGFGHIKSIYGLKGILSNY